MTLDEFFAEIADFEFVVVGNALGNRTIRTGGEYLCPICALATAKGPTKFANNQACAAAKLLGLSDHDATTIVAAADDLKTGSPSIRHRLAACGLTARQKRMEEVKTEKDKSLPNKLPVRVSRLQREYSVNAAHAALSKKGT